MGMSTRRPSFSSSLSMMQERGAAGGDGEAAADPPSLLGPLPQAGPVPLGIGACGTLRGSVSRTRARTGLVQGRARMHQRAHEGPLLERPQVGVNQVRLGMRLGGVGTPAACQPHLPFVLSWNAVHSGGNTAPTAKLPTRGLQRPHRPPLPPSSLPHTAMRTHLASPPVQRSKVAPASADPSHPVNMSANPAQVSSARTMETDTCYAAAAD